ncbi:hypothetical protein R3P38DRAFT_2765037 [Favolaschia claudopus]|uniref:Uncharacterized protein n=1 Tax=Favolaschia claudopus TaxID=2862362 RepID=A0AAW0DCX6_9AGAR
MPTMNGWGQAEGREMHARNMSGMLMVPAAMKTASGGSLRRAGEDVGLRGVPMGSTAYVVGRLGGISMMSSVREMVRDGGDRQWMWMWMWGGGGSDGQLIQRRGRTNPRASVSTAHLILLPAPDQSLLAVTLTPSPEIVTPPLRPAPAPSPLLQSPTTLDDDDFEEDRSPRGRSGGVKCETEMQLGVVSMGRGLSGVRGVMLDVGLPPPSLPSPPPPLEDLRSHPSYTSSPTSSASYLAFPPHLHYHQSIADKNTIPAPRRAHTANGFHAQATAEWRCEVRRGEVVECGEDVGGRRKREAASRRRWGYNQGL